MAIGSFRRTSCSRNNSCSPRPGFPAPKRRPGPDESKFRQHVMTSIRGPSTGQVSRRPSQIARDGQAYLQTVQHNAMRCVEPRRRRACGSHGWRALTCRVQSLLRESRASRERRTWFKQSLREEPYNRSYRIIQMRTLTRVSSSHFTFIFAFSAACSFDV